MTVRKSYVAGAALVSCAATLGFAKWSGRHKLTEVYRNEHFRLTGISVSKTSRLFVNFPRWSDNYLNAVIEVMPDGSEKPFPDKYWNGWDLKPATAGKQFVCVQSVVVDDTDALWVLDPAAPLLTSPVPGGPKLVEIDLKTDKVSRIIHFEPDVVLPDSYLNDVRFDTRRGTAYITDSGHGGIVVLDLATSKAHRALDADRSVMAEQGVQVIVNGKPVLFNGKPPMFNSDGIALSPDGEYLYYKPVTAVPLYRIKTVVLREKNASPATVAAAVEKVAATFPTDGLWMDSNNRLYLSDVNHNAVVRLSPKGKMETVVEDPRLQWPDTFSEGPDGSIYISASHINESPTYNEGISARTQPYGVFKLKP